jgi:hypothetical protein
MVRCFSRSRFANFEISGLCYSHLCSGSDCKRQEWDFRSLCNGPGGKSEEEDADHASWTQSCLEREVLLVSEWWSFGCDLCVTFLMQIIYDTKQSFPNDVQLTVYRACVRARACVSASPNLFIILVIPQRHATAWHKGAYTHTRAHAHVCVYMHIYIQGSSNMTGTNCGLFTHK